MGITIGSNITILDKNDTVQYEMACFDISEDEDKTIYYFQSIDTNGKMEEMEISEDIFNLLNWQESPIPRFFRFDKISDIIENYHNMSQLDLKGFSGCYDKDNDVNSVSLYLSNNSLYIEIICFGVFYPHRIDKEHYFLRKKKNIPFIYIKESNKIADLHLNEENKIFFIPPSRISSYNMNDISCWSGEDYFNKLAVPIHPLLKEPIERIITLDGYGVEFESNIDPNLKWQFNLSSYNLDMICIFDHKNIRCLEFFDNGILIDTRGYENVKIFTFIKNLKSYT